MRVDESTDITIPIRNLVAVGLGLCLFVGQFFMITHRLSTLEGDVKLHSVEVIKARQFRYDWSRGELGMVGIDIEQDTRLENIDRRINLLREGLEYHAKQDDEHN